MKNFFSHDEGARNDPKLIKVLMKLGQEGKGVYWDLVEMLYEQDGYLMLPECDSYAFALRTKCELIESLIRDFGLFENDGVKFWSNSILRRLCIRKEKSQKASESAAKRWGNANAMRTHSEGNAIQDNIVKEKKEETEVKKGKDAPTGAVEFSFPLNWTPSMISAYEDSWLVYRQKGFKTKLRPESIQKQIIQLSELPEPQVIACINNSIANGYQGLILDKFRALNGTHINGTGTAFQAKHAIPD